MYTGLSEDMSLGLLAGFKLPPAITPIMTLTATPRSERGVPTFCWVPIRWETSQNESETSIWRSATARLIGFYSSSTNIRSRPGEIIPRKRIQRRARPLLQLRPGRPSQRARSDVYGARFESDSRPGQRGRHAKQRLRSSAARAGGRNKIRNTEILCRRGVSGFPIRERNQLTTPYLIKTILSYDF